jgi:putative ABC transport system substrate-binding protein
MRRREFITLLGGAVAAPTILRSSPASAQQDGRVRRIGMLAVGAENDRFIRMRWSVMREGLARMGWVDGRNVRFDYRYVADTPDRMSLYADELVSLAPDVIAVGSAAATRALMRRTQTIPIIFNDVGDPVAGGLLKSIARPEGNLTGTTSLYESIAGKWLELLQEAAPATTRVGLIFVPDIVADSYFAAIDEAANALALKAIRIPYRTATELERAINTFAEEANGGLVMVPPPPTALGHRELINRLAVKHRLPTMYSQKTYGPSDGGLMSYGANGIEGYRTSASYIDRILRGAKINELPVQFPAGFDLVVNLKTARAIGLTISEAFLLRADELIE